MKINKQYIRDNWSKIVETSAWVLIAAVLTIFLVQDADQNRQLTDYNLNDGYLVAGPPTQPANQANQGLAGGSKVSNISGTSKPPTYQSLVNDYQGYRLQIKDCVATPYNVTYTAGTRIMLDGFSPEPQVVTIGSQTVTLNGYDIAYVTLDGESGQKITETVDCQHADKQHYNIARLLIQP